MYVIVNIESEREVVIMKSEKKISITKSEVKTLLDIVETCEKFGIVLDEFAYAVSEHKDSVWAEESEDGDDINIVYVN